MKSLICTILVLFAFPLISHSQSGPAGVGDALTNSIWLVADGNSYTDAGVTTATNGSSIQQWNDISGNNNNPIQTNNSFKPIYNTNQVNGFSSIGFDGNNDRILATGVSTSNQATLFVAVRHTSIVNGNDGIIQASPAGQAFSGSGNSKSIGMWTSNTTQTWGRAVQSNGNVRNIPRVLSVALGQFNIITQDMDGATISQYLNHAISGSITYDGTLQDWSDFGIGRQGFETLNGDIAEIIVYNVSVNAAQRTIINNYLAAKYNIPLALDDIYDADDFANGDFDFEVAGIGRVNSSNIHDDAQGTGIIRFSNASDLNDDEFLMWGHDGGLLEFNEVTDIPARTLSRLSRVWRVSETNSSATSVDVGAIDIEVDINGITGTSGVNENYIRLLVDTDNDGVFDDEHPIGRATLVSPNVYRFIGVTTISDNLRFTLGIGRKTVISNRKITYRVN